MDKFKQELIEGIIEVANETGLTTDKCIRQALELLEKEKESKRKEYIAMTEKQMFKNW